MNRSHNSADWFEKITGFSEGPYRWTQERLQIQDGCLVSTKDGKRHRVGRFDLISLTSLREISPSVTGGSLNVRAIVGDARALHCDAANAGATFQVASQFNALEMVSPDITPERGVTQYEFDRTQGPACAIAAGAGTIWRNYLVPMDSAIGQRATHQLDGLHDLGQAFSDAMSMPVKHFWVMRNGYAMCSVEGLQSISKLLHDCDEEERDRLRGLIRIGWHQDVDVTDLEVASRHQVNQVYCSALPVAYGRHPSHLWEPFARLVLEAAYEATLLASSIKAVQGGSRRVLLTGLGGGAFGNQSNWISDALDFALDRVKKADLDVILVGYGRVPEHFKRFE